MQTIACQLLLTLIPVWLGLYPFQGQCTLIYLTLLFYSALTPDNFKTQQRKSAANLLWVKQNNSAVLLTH